MSFLHLANLAARARCFEHVARAPTAFRLRVQAAVDKEGMHIELIFILYTYLRLFLANICAKYVKLVLKIL